MCLSEGVYKVVDYGEERAAEILTAIMEGFPPGLVTMKRVEWSQPDAQHRSVIGEADGALYVAFMGTKQRRDLVANAQVIQEPVWPEDAAAFQDSTPQVPAAHRGFLTRAQSVPIESLYEHACRQKKRLVLSGHSLGGAVAVLATLRLLRQLPPGAQPALRCNVFACPAIGNAALAAYVRDMGWEHYFNNLLVPEDAVPRILGGLPQQLSMPATEMFHAADAAESRLAAARSMLSKKLSFRLAARPVAASTAATAVGSAATISRGRSKGSLSSEEQPPARRRSATGLDSWKDGAEEPGFSVEDKHSSGVREDDGSEWDVLSASLDESGGGQDFEAGLGVQPHLAAQHREGAGGVWAGRRVRNRTDDHDRSLTPIWPMSLYPLSYREDVSVEQPLGGDDESKPSCHGDHMQPSAAPLPPAVASAQDTPAAIADRSEALEPVSVRESVELSVDEDDHAAQLGMQATLVRMDSDAANHEGQDSTASTSTLARQAVTGDQAHSVRKQSSRAVGHTANNAVPAQPISRLTAVRQTAARAGRVVLGASAFGARMGVGLAGAGVRTAASIATTPFRVPFRAAQRRYFPIGRQLFLYSDTVSTVLPGSKEGAADPMQALVKSQQPDDVLPLDTRLLRQSALPSKEKAALVAGATPPGRGRLPQPFIMHKMAFHRGRALGIIRNTLRSSLPRSDASDAPGETYVLNDAIFDDVLALKPPSAVWPRPSAIGAVSGKRSKASRGRKAKPPLLTPGLAPMLKARSAEAWVEWALPGIEDVEQMMKDLGSLSDPARLGAARTGSGSATLAAAEQRWRWLLPWTWILGAWSSARERKDFVLDVTVRGAGLDTCSSVQVQALGEVWCRAAIVRRPPAAAPARVNAALHPGAPDMVRTAALLLSWVSAGARWLLGAVDRQNATGTQRDLQVRVWVPAAVMRRAQALMVQGTGPVSSGLTVVLRSDFYESTVPLQIHAGGSAVFSDLQLAWKAFLDWGRRNLEGGL
ncbi:g4869 [Coccomyxa elongata]